MPSVALKEIRKSNGTSSLTKSMVAIITILSVLSMTFGCGNHGQLVAAIRAHNAAAVKSICRSHQSLVLAEDEAGRTALDIAIKYNDPEVVQILVDAGSDMYHESARLGMPLPAAASFGQLKIIEILIAAGCDIDRQPQRESTLGHGTALHTAVRARKIEAVRFLLEKHATVGVHAKFLDGVTPLHSAAVNDPEEPETIDIVRLLLDHGADINAKSDDGKTPLAMAMQTPTAKKEGKPLIELLVKKGGKQ
jgi:ankyrin repeat protein